MSTKFFRFTSILVATFAALSTIENSANAFVIFDSKGKSPSATDPAPVPAFTAIAASNGVFYHNSDNGHISYCGNTTDPSTFQPNGTCEAIGSTEKSSAGFSYSTVESSVFIVNKSSGTIVQCTATGKTGEKIKGGCAPRASIQSL